MRMKYCSRVLALLLAVSLMAGNCVPVMATEAQAGETETSADTAQEENDEAEEAALGSDSGEEAASSGESVDAQETSGETGIGNENSDNADETEGAEEDAEANTTANPEIQQEEEQEQDPETGDTPEETDEESLQVESEPVEEEAETVTETVTEEAEIPELAASASGSYEGVSWELSSSGVLTVEGEGNYRDSTNWVVPWNDYRTSIKEAVVSLSGATTFRYMFYDCTNLTTVDFSGSDTSEVTTLEGMFSGCSSLKTVDFSGCDFGNVTDISWMFNECSSLTSVSLGYNMDKGNLTSMARLFYECSSLTAVDLSGLNTGNVTSMYSMFSGCSSLKTLDLSNLDFSSATAMGGLLSNCSNLTSVKLGNFAPGASSLNMMFYNCTNLTSIDFGDADFSKVTVMANMFQNCSSLKTLDFSCFKCAAEVLSMTDMFNGCSSLTSLAMGSSTVTYASNMFNGCTKLKVLDLRNFNLASSSTSFSLSACTALTMIYAPVNLTEKVSLPSGTWYCSDGTKVKTLPTGLTETTIIKKGVETLSARTIHDAAEVSGDEIVDLSSLFSGYGVVSGILVRSVTDDNEILNGTPSVSLQDGSYILTYTSNTGEEGQSAVIELFVSFQSGKDGECSLTIQKGREEVTISGVTAGSRSYNGKTYSYAGSPVVTGENGDDLSSEVSLTATWTKIDGETETELDGAPMQAGDYRLTLSVPEDDRHYAGEASYLFCIRPAALTVTAKSVNLEAAAAETGVAYTYQVSGLLSEDSFEEEPVFTVKNEESAMSTAGVYAIAISNADSVKIVHGEEDVTASYAVTYVDGELRVSEELVGYTVTFETGKTDAETDSIYGVKAGSTISEPDAPTANGYCFLGWYKDEACSTAWNFASDIVQADTTLYAKRAVIATAGDDFRVSEVTDYTYTGSAIKPSVSVYDDETLLKAGKDYTVSYVNNTNAYSWASDTTMIGTYDSAASIEGPCVIIKGKGNYAGSALYVKFNILPMSISDDDGDVADGVTLKYTEQSVVNTKKAVSPFSSIKYKKALTKDDYTLTLTDENGEAQADAKIPANGTGTYTLIIEGTGNYTGKIEKTVYVAQKANLIKNATITLGKSIKTQEYQDGEEITLPSGYFVGKTYYLTDGTPADAAGLFTVKSGKTCLTEGVDYEVSYENNVNVGTATLTVTGINDYAGSKSVTFKITGKTFSEKTVTAESVAEQTYTGFAITQNSAVLTYKENANAEEKTLTYGTDYTISYKNNIKKGTATMAFRGLESAGYTGSFTKTFKISPAQITSVEGLDATLSAEYSKSGAKPSLTLTLRTDSGTYTLTEGVDYTLSCSNNKTVTTEGSNATVKIKGKGNFAGTSESISYTVTAKSLDSDDISVAITPIYVDGKTRKLSVTVKDGKTTLKKGTDYDFDEDSCSAEIAAWAQDQSGALPTLTLTAGSGGNYAAGTTQWTIPIYKTKLTSSNTCIWVDPYTYGDGTAPSISVYYSEDASLIKEAKKAGSREELAKMSGLTELTADQDYEITSWSAGSAGKNKGSVTISGTAPGYGGSVTQKFTVSARTLAW